MMLKAHHVCVIAVSVAHKHLGADSLTVQRTQQAICCNRRSARSLCCVNYQYLHNVIMCNITQKYTFSPYFSVFLY
jgi:hypothetical protein